MNKYAEFRKQEEQARKVMFRAHNRNLVQCIKKKSFHSKEQASTFLDSNGYVCRIYKCPSCLLWHTSSHL